MPTDNRCEVPPPFTREELGLPEEAVVFASFNRLDKLTRQMFSTWCKILANVPNSVLWLWCDQPRARTQLQKAAASLGVAPERILFAPSESHRNHLARLQCVDLALDTFPYTSHTTGVDALWVGVPLLAMQGETFASRVSASHMHSVGLPELIAYSHDEYAAKAIALAEDRAQLQAYRHHLVSTRAALPLFDTQRFTRNLAALYQRIWQNHCAGIHEALPAIPD